VQASSPDGEVAGLQKTISIMKRYSDITPLLEKKAKHRRQMAQMPFEEKVKILRRLQRQRAEIKAAASKVRPKALS
jgi:hypothetical protein